MKKFFHLQKLSVMLFLCLFIFKANAQQKFDKTSAQWTEINRLKAKVEANPSNLKLHENFIKAFDVDDPAIIIVYQNWEKKFPKEYAVPFAIGRALANREILNAKDFLLHTSVLKPDNAETWSLLALLDARLQGNPRKNEFLQKAAFYAPKNPEYLFNYAYSFKDTDTQKYDSLSLEVARKFPNSEIAAQAVYWLAANTALQSKKLAYFKLVQTKLTNYNSPWYLSTMIQYFDLLLKTNTEQAFELGLQMRVQDKIFPELWHERLAVANAFLEAKNLINNNHPEQALKLLNQIRLNNTMMADRHIDAKEYLLLSKAEALDSAKMFKPAYDTIANYYIKNPSEKLQAVLYKYGRQNGMESILVNKNIASMRNNIAKQAKDFSLKKYTDTTKTSLADYKGKVVLLTYWFPGCGPCRAEFPYFENVLKKFNRQDVAYLGLNVEPSQDAAVLPIIKENGYTFTPLHDSEERIKGNLGTIGQPTNYLIDQKGRIVFANFRINQENEKTLELMIKEILAAKD